VAPQQAVGSDLRQVSAILLSEFGADAIKDRRSNTDPAKSPHFSAAVAVWRRVLRDGQRDSGRVARGRRAGDRGCAGLLSP